MMNIRFFALLSVSIAGFALLEVVKWRNIIRNKDWYCWSWAEDETTTPTERRLMWIGFCSGIVFGILAFWLG